MQCVVCGKEFTDKVYDGTVCSTHCYLKRYWEETLDTFAIIIDGNCYHIDGRVNSKNVTILFDDGIKMVTSHLILDGKIPEEFLVPDNAKFI